jgi:hypothetical protein
VIDGPPSNQDDGKPLAFGSRDAIFDWANREYGQEWLDALSPAQVAALGAIKSPAYTAINSYLRSGRDSVLPSIATIRRWVGDANTALEERPLPRAVEAYRGADLDAMLGLPDPSEAVGGIFRDRGFVSTTLWRPVAERFARDLILMVVPRGTPAAWMERIESRNEFELLLQMDNLFRIDGFEAHDAQRILQVTVIGRLS